jgi:hypothetical protein
MNPEFGGPPPTMLKKGLWVRSIITITPRIIELLWLNRHCASV